MAEIVENFKRVAEKIKTAHERFNIPAGPAPKIVAVSKNHPAEKILPLLEYGHRIFGENKVQEAYAKWPALKENFPDIELHLIGPVQSNKAREALELFDVIETLDREKIALIFANLLKERPKKINFLIQVNIGEEPQKAGILPKDAGAFAKFCMHDLQLPVSGLMCIPPLGAPSALYFGLLKKLGEETSLKNLSMGMSGDFEAAAAMGASYVRIGTAIFGEREYVPA